MLFDVNRFHLMALLTWQLCIFFATQQIFPIFSNYVPEWQCKDGPIGKNCDEYRRCSGNITFINPSFNSAAVEFRWLCDDAYAAALFPQMQFIGVLLGTVSFGVLTDIFGRKPVSLFTLTLGLAATVLSGRHNNND